MSDTRLTDETPKVGARFVPYNSRGSYVVSLRVVHVAEGYVMYEATAARDGHTFMDVMKVNVFNNVYKKQLLDRPLYVNIYDGDWYYDSLEDANDRGSLGGRIGVLFLLPDGTTGFLPENEARRER